MNYPEDMFRAKMDWALANWRSSAADPTSPPEKALYWENMLDHFAKALCEHLDQERSR